MQKKKKTVRYTCNVYRLSIYYVTAMVLNTSSQQCHQPLYHSHVPYTVLQPCPTLYCSHALHCTAVMPYTVLQSCPTLYAAVMPYTVLQSCPTLYISHALHCTAVMPYTVLQSCPTLYSSHVLHCTLTH